MPITETTTIVCDNPNCPGNTLDPHDRAGWLYVSTAVYGSPQYVYCCADCLVADTPARPPA